MGTTTATTGTTGTLAALLVLIGVVAVANVVRSAVVPSRFHFAFNLALAAVALLIAAVASMTLDELGLDPADLARGLRYGAVAFAGISAVVILAALVPAFGKAFDDDRADITLGALLVKTLVTIPIGTVLVEELIFRGVMLGLLRRLAPTAVAVLIGSLLFGLWHVYPAWRGGGDNAALADTGRLSTVLGTFGVTTLVGVFFCWLRLASGSLAAPMLAHVATNSVPLAVAWVVSRR